VPASNSSLTLTDSSYATVSPEKNAKKYRYKSGIFIQVSDLLA
jgi:hypothetical protein